MGIARSGRRSTGMSACLLALAAGSAAHGAAPALLPKVLLADLVALRTAPGETPTAEAVDYVRRTLAAAGVPDDQMAMVERGGARGLLVRIPGSADRKAVVFSAHLDVVAARPADWAHDPFVLREERGYFVGRGVLDNKAGVVALIETIRRLTRDRVHPQRPLVFAFVGDEETDGETTRAIAEHPWFRHAWAVINTDVGRGFLDAQNRPLFYAASTGEKNSVTFTIATKNPGGHSSRPRDDNAIYDLARALDRLAGLRFPVMISPATRAYLAQAGRFQSAPLGPALARLAADPADEAAAALIARSPEFNGVVRTTCVATMIEGGHAFNALPQSARATVNCRLVPTDTPERVQARLVAAIGNPAVTVTPAWPPSASPDLAVPEPVLRAITAAIGRRFPGTPVVFGLEPGGTDGKVYRGAGVPTVGSSGMFIRPEDMRAHGAEEQLPVRALDDGIAHIEGLARTLGAH